MLNIYRRGQRPKRISLQCHSNPTLKHLFALASQLGDGMQMKRQRWRQSAPQNNGQEPGSHGATALDPNPGIQRKTRHRQALKGGSVGLRGFVVDGWRSITTWIGLTNDSQAKESAAPEERTAGGFSGRHQSGSRHRTLHNPPPIDTAYIHTYTSLSAYPVSRSNRKTAAKLLLVQRGPSTATRIHKIDGWLAGEASHIAATRDAARTPPPLLPTLCIYIFMHRGGPPRKSKAKTISRLCMCIFGWVNTSVSVVLRCELRFFVANRGKTFSTWHNRT